MESRTNLEYADPADPAEYIAWVRGSHYLNASGSSALRRSNFTSWALMARSNALVLLVNKSNSARFVDHASTLEASQVEVGAYQSSATSYQISIWALRLQHLYYGSDLHLDGVVRSKAHHTKSFRYGY